MDVSGPSSDYDDDDEAHLYDWLDDGWKDYDEDEDGDPAGDPSAMTVNARVEWAGVTDRARDGQRTVNLQGLDLSGVRDALTAARQATSKAQSAGNTFTAKGWQAQLTTLLRDSRGSGASDRAGLSPTRETVLRWLTGDAVPNKANQERLAAAYRDVREQVIGTARDKASSARHELAEQVNTALERTYGSEIRLRNITQLDLGD